MVNECIICKGTNAVPFYSGLLKCQGCGHVFADLHLDEKELSEIYRKDYFFGNEYSDYIADKDVLQKNFKLRLRILKKYIDPYYHKSLIEIGSAYGFFLDVVRHDFDSVQGIDITEDGVRYAREKLNLNILHGDFLGVDLDNQKFDVVCLWDTIEHLSYPHLYIEKISKHTKAGSLLAITTGDIESLNARIKKDKWRLIHPPTHIHYFSIAALTKLLGNYGFDVIYNRYCGFYRSVNNVAYNVLVLRKRLLWLYNLLRKSGITNLDFYLNLYDIMYVIARKSELPPN